MAVLFSGYLRYDFDAPENAANDHLVFSKGHASPLLYALYKAAGAIDDEELLTFRELGSRLQGHPTPEIPWVDVATGSLGQGLPIAVGIALAASRLESSDLRVWVLCGDSELAEGSMWEAFEQAGHAKLDNLIAIVDVNRLGQRGPTMHGWDTSSLAARASACGWDVQEIDGHDLEAIDAAYARAQDADRPAVIFARTKKGSGVAAVEDKENQHGKPLADPEAAVEELGGIRSLGVTVQAPPEPKPYADREGAGRAPELRARREGRDPRRLRRRPGLDRLGRREGRGARRRGRQLDLRRALRRKAPRPLLRDVHRRAADGRRRDRHADARLEAVRLLLRRLPQPRLRLRPHGGDLRRRPEALRVPRRRLDRPRRALADGARRHRLPARRPRQRGALPQRRQPGGAAARRDARAPRHQLHADDPRGDPGALRGRTRPSRSAAAAPSAPATRTPSP